QIPVAAQDLHRVGGDTHRRIRGEDFRHRRADADVGQVAVQRVCRGIGQGAGRLDLGGHFGQHELYPLELDDRFAELTPVARVAADEVEGTLRDPEPLRPAPGT